jgi:hypothetical protein
VVGGDYERPEVAGATAAWTEDGGASWQACARDGMPYRSGVVWLDAAHVLAVGPQGASLSGDGGRTWTQFGADGYHAVAKGGDGSVWACGSDGRVARLVPR